MGGGGWVRGEKSDPFQHYSDHPVIDGSVIAADCPVRRAGRGRVFFMDYR